MARAIECYEMVRDYDKILDALENMKDLSFQQRKAYGRKYVPLALQKLTQEIRFKSAEKQSDSEEIIKEEESVSEEEDNSDKDRCRKMKLTKKKEPEEEVKREVVRGKKCSKSKKDISVMSFDVIDKSHQSKEISFVELKEEENHKNVSNLSFENVEAPIEDFEHLSQYDFKDEFLRSDSVSVIDSIKSQRKEKSFIASEFSAIEYNYLMDARYHLVQTKGDIFIQDSVMEKIIKYISMFSDEFKDNLEKLRSKEMLLSQETESEKRLTDVHVVTYDLIDLDNVSLEFVYLILDFLEQSKLYKLCMFVCNRYKLAEKLGRYLVNIAFKYSNLPSEDIRANFSKLFNARNRQIQREKAFVANTAVHNILEITNPKYLKLKKKEETIDDTNSLGDTCYSSLISLGFWKKTLFS